MRTAPILSLQSTELPQTSIKGRRPYQLQVFPSRPDSLADFKINTGHKRMFSLPRAVVVGFLGVCLTLEYFSLWVDLNVLCGKMNIYFKATSVEPWFSFLKTKLSTALKKPNRKQISGSHSMQITFTQTTKEKLRLDLSGCYSAQTTASPGKLRSSAGNGTSNTSVQPENPFFPPYINRNA